MKKLLIGMGLLIFLGVSSCKKDYTCECTWVTGSLEGQVQTLNSSEKLSKKDATTWCEDQTYEGASFECELK